MFNDQHGSEKVNFYKTCIKHARKILGQNQTKPRNSVCYFFGWGQFNFEDPPPVTATDNPVGTPSFSPSHQIHFADEAEVEQSFKGGYWILSYWRSTWGSN